MNDERVLAQVMSVLSKNKQGISKTSVKTQVGGRSNTVARVVNEALLSGLISAKLVKAPSRGRPSERLFLTAAGKQYFRDIKHYAKDFTPHPDVGTEWWEGKRFFIEDANLETFRRSVSSEDEMYAMLSLGTFVTVKCRAQGSMTLSDVLRCVPSSWKKMPERDVLVRVCIAWLQHGFLLCSFDSISSEWLVQSSEMMLQRVAEIGSFTKFSQLSKQKYSSWKYT